MNIHGRQVVWDFQVGIDAQYTWEATLFKFEGIWREGQRNLAFEEGCSKCYDCGFSQC